MDYIETDDEAVEIGSSKKRITSDTDPQMLEEGDEIRVVFRPSEDVPPDIPTAFVVRSDQAHPDYDILEETTPGFEDRQDLFHRKQKLISPKNFFNADAMRGKRAKQIAAAAAIVAAAGGATWLIIKKRQKS